MKTTKKKSLLEECPDIAKEWHPTFNAFKPDEITAGSGKRAYFACKTCGYGKDGEWITRIQSRTTKNTGCPACSNKVLVKGFNDIATKFPEIAKEWHPTLNDFKPDELIFSTQKKAYFICSSCGYGKDGSWNTQIRNRTKYRSGCPACDGKIVFKGFNDLATKFPEIAKEWHPTLNVFKPDEVTPCSLKKAYFICSFCGYGKNGEIHSRVSERTTGRRRCAVCAGRILLKGFNDLATKFPEIAREWHPMLNNCKADEIVAGSNKKAYFICSSCGYGKNGEWSTKLTNRTCKTKKTNCPACNLSKGEKEIKNILKKYKITYKTQYKNKNCVHIHALPFDFAVMKNGKIILLIEFDGKQHFEPVEHFGGKEYFDITQKKDKIKNEYCKKNNIPLIRIPYWDFDNIESILLENLLKYNLLKSM